MLSMLPPLYSVRAMQGNWRHTFRKVLIQRAPRGSHLFSAVYDDSVWYQGIIRKYSFCKVGYRQPRCTRKSRNYWYQLRIWVKLMGPIPQKTNFYHLELVRPHPSHLDRCVSHPTLHFSKWFWFLTFPRGKLWTTQLCTWRLEDSFSL